MKPLIYLASPFFKPSQIETIKRVEMAVNEAGISYYSPRADGTLKDMTPEERKAAAPKVFKTNCAHILHANAVLAVLDEWDAGTTWECGFAFALKRYSLGVTTGQLVPSRLFAITTERPSLNIMLQGSFDAHAVGWEQLTALLELYAAGKPVVEPEILRTCTDD